MSLLRCDCCDLPVESCGKAIEEREREEQRIHDALLAISGWFPAKYAGRCVRCSDEFEVGSMITPQGFGYRCCG